MRRCLCLLLIMFAAGCAQPFEGRVASRLTEAGLPPRMAQCMAKRWVDRLSIAQLRKIQRLSEDLKRERSAGGLTAIQLIGRVRAMNDPEILDVVTRSTIACAF